MRERVIALIVCSMIFVAVLIIGVITAARSTVRTEPEKPVAVEKAPVQPLPPPPPEEPPPKKTRYKRRNAPAVYSNFINPAAPVKLPGNLAAYKFKAGILVDLNTRKVLWSKNASIPVPIASLTKLLTIYTAFEELEQREELNLHSLVTVSRECTLAAPVKIRLTPGEKVKLHHLFIYSMLKSANDASHLLAEYFGYGDSSRFIAMMNNKAREINMTSSSFVNANGLPIYGTTPQDVQMNRASCMDMVKLIERLYEYPMIIRYTSSRQTTTPRGTLNNGNRLLGAVPGMEGLKTGYTNAAGNCLAFSCRRNGRRLVGVVTGFSKRQNCFDFTRKLLEWGFKN